MEKENSAVSDVHFTMAHYELDRFYFKFKNLLFAGKDASLNMKSEGGRATVTLSLDLGHVHDQRQQFHRSRNGPARQRRREKRAASRSEKEHNTVQQPQADAEIAITDVEETSDSVEAEKASEKVVESVEENIPIEETEVESFTCILCDFTSKWKNGLAIHMTRKHCNIELLDGTTDETDEDEKYERSCHYWKNGIAYQSSIRDNRIQ